ncbi:MAG: acetyltransferase [Betaproteobacteria bacterium]|nr:acetyltransferase [Betaproteobacteria bacterium]
MAKKLVIVGAGKTAELFGTYFKDADRQVVGFAVESRFINKTDMLGLPIVAFESVEDKFPAREHEMFIAIASSRLNRDRARLFEMAKSKGYNFASYVSPHAYLDKHAKIGENVFIFENNVVQYGCSIGDDTILWSGNHIGHETEIGKHVFISSHIVISGYCKIGDYCFLGVNSTIADSVELGRDCTVGAGALIAGNLAANCIVQPAKMDIREGLSRKFWKVRE